MRVLIVQNDETETLGLYVRYLLKKGIEHEVFHAYDMEIDDPFPSTCDYDAFIIGPTPISANSVDQHGFLRKEWGFLGEVIESGKPCLGVCCGGQMLARRLGAEVRKSPEKEVGGYKVRLTEAGKLDPLFVGFPQEFPVFHWHNDTFEVPPGGELLVEGDPCSTQAFGWKNLRGIIFHLEIDGSEAECWTSAYQAELDTVGKMREQVIRECREREPEMRMLAHRLINNFLRLGTV